jgi:hypothetical protein
LPTPFPDLGLTMPRSEASMIQVKNCSGNITHRISFSIKGGKRLGFSNRYSEVRV